MNAALFKIGIGKAYENDRWHNKLIRSLLTPRKIAWFFVVSGITWFIYISPETPIEFFDANALDEAAVRAMTVEKNKIADPVGAAKSQKMDDLIGRFDVLRAPNGTDCTFVRFSKQPGPSEFREIFNRRWILPHR